MKKKKIRNFFLFFFLMLVFFILILIYKENDIIKEESYIEISNDYLNNIDQNFVDYENDFNKILTDLKRKEKENKINFRYFPDSLILEEKIKNYKKYLDLFFLSDYINPKIENINIFLHKNDFEVRWRLKEKKIHIFGIYNMSEKEVLSVVIHEFAHFFDLYVLKKWVFKDLSYDFYKISWDERNILKKEAKINDFISGYAMTNMYEDFAESFTFYILHNKKFLEKTNFSENLRKKYDFFSKNIFLKEEFKNLDFWTKKYPKQIWDTTKIEFDLDKFSAYLKG